MLGVYESLSPSGDAAMSLKMTYLLLSFTAQSLLVKALLADSILYPKTIVQVGDFDYSQDYSRHIGQSDTSSLAGELSKEGTTTDISTPRLTKQISGILPNHTYPRLSAATGADINRKTKRFDGLLLLLQQLDTNSNLRKRLKGNCYGSLQHSQLH